MQTTRRNILLGAASAAALSSLGLAGCASRTQTVAINNTAAGKLHSVTVPVDPKRLAVLDYSVMENLQALGLTDRVVAHVEARTLPWIKPAPAASVAVESLKTVDTEQLAQVKPDLIFISGRVARAFDDFSKVAPTLCLAPNYEKGSFASFKESLSTLGVIFEKERETAYIIELAQKRIDTLRAQTAGQTIAVLMVIGGRVGVLPDNGRCSFLTEAMGFVNVAGPRTGSAAKKPKAKTAPTAAEITAGNQKSFERLAHLNPDRIYVLNKDLAVGSRNPSDFDAVVSGNALWQNLSAVKAGKVKLLTAPAWYLGEGGVASLDKMLTDVEESLKL